MQTLIDILWNLWGVLAEMAPWLVIGFLFAGLLSVFFKPAWVERHLGRPGWASIFKASAFGVPLPLCSCGVIPVGTMMYRHGASKGATVSFLLSTPQTGVDSILATWGAARAVVRDRPAGHRAAQRLPGRHRDRPRDPARAT